MARPDHQLTVAVTGPTGTLGSALLPVLEHDERIGRVVGIARRPFDPAAHGWTKMTYRRGDVRDPARLSAAFRDADAVVHLAFMVAGSASPAARRAVNVEGTLNALRAAGGAGAARFVYTSSVAAYGFHADNPVGMSEDWPVRPADHLDYAREKADLERLLADESAALPQLGLYILRPPIVVGPHTIGAKQFLPGPLDAAGRRLGGLVRRLPVPLPVPVPSVAAQLIHEDDVARALLLCILGAGPPGAYNVAGDGVVSSDDIARELGLAPLPLPGGIARPAARALAGLARLPLVPHAAAWAETVSQPAIMDTTKAREQLGWRPHHSSLGALRATLSPPTGGQEARPGR
ncbi:MAG TPA: NAD-dependent epimerase/dehydratase family protein [Acidimicrobiales bacterium]